MKLTEKIKLNEAGNNSYGLPSRIEFAKQCMILDVEGSTQLLYDWLITYMEKHSKIKK